MSKTLMMERIIHTDGSRFSWVLVDKHSSHVYAQGNCKYRGTAERQTAETAGKIGQDLGLEVVLNDYGI